MIAIGFLPVLGVCNLLGDDRSGLILAIGGPIIVALDVAYRFQWSSGDLLQPGHGGKFLFLPIWLFGIFWFAYGMWQLKG